MGESKEEKDMWLIGPLRGFQIQMPAYFSFV